LTLSEQDLLYTMRYNTRDNIRKANRKGIGVQEFGIDYIGDLYKLYHDIAIRYKMPIQNQDYFSAILKNQINSKNGVNIKMLMADLGGEFLSSMFLFY
jgi:lipid II:glycine glycyltransferase (peptidoglycan interpeptide bridge formation enzyme)